MTFAQIKQQVLALLQEIDFEGHYPEALINTFVNEGKNTFESEARVYIKKDSRLVNSFDDSEEVDGSVYYYKYNITDMVDMLHIGYKNSSTVTALQRYGSHEIEDFGFANLAAKSVYSVEGGGINFYNVSDYEATDSLVMKYVAIEPDFTLATQTPLIPTFLISGIVYAAVIIALASEGERNNYIEQLYGNAVRKGIDYAHNTGLQIDTFFTDNKPNDMTDYINNY